jgi:hypothetical protein
MRGQRDDTNFSNGSSKTQTTFNNFPIKDQKRLPESFAIYVKQLIKTKFCLPLQEFKFTNSL